MTDKEIKKRVKRAMGLMAATDSYMTELNKAIIDKFFNAMVEKAKENVECIKNKHKWIPDIREGIALPIYKPLKHLPKVIHVKEMSLPIPNFDIDKRRICVHCGREEYHKKSTGHWYKNYITEAREDFKKILPPFKGKPA